MKKISMGILLLLVLCLIAVPVFSQDIDDDGIDDSVDNCPSVYNPTQDDTYPPDGNGCGDACECEGNFNGDDDCDGTDASTFKLDYGRLQFDNPCESGNPCSGDFNCDGDVDGTDASLFKLDYGRLSFDNPCPSCGEADWCSYPPSDIVNIKDPNLAAALRDALGLGDGDDITEGDLETLSSLSAAGEEITDIEGLEHCQSVTELNLSGNSITSLLPLSDLSSLTKLYLSGNRITDISDLSGLTALTELDLSYNKISDLSPLETLTSLQTLYLTFNHITGITPLVNNTGMDSGDTLTLTGNNLSETAIDTSIPNLEARSVSVSFEDGYSSSSGFPGMTAGSSIVAFGLGDSTVYNYTLESGAAGMSVDVDGNLSWDIPSDAQTEVSEPFLVRADNTVTGASYYLMGSIYVMLGQVEGTGFVDSSGGTVQDSTGEISITIAPGTASQDTVISILTGENEYGNPVIGFTSDQPLDGEVTITLPPIEGFGQAGVQQTNTTDLRFEAAASRSDKEFLDEVWKSYWAYWLDTSSLPGVFTRTNARVEKHNIIIDVINALSLSFPMHEASVLYSSRPETDDFTGMVPVLFIHGYVADILGFVKHGGGEKYWGDFPELLQEDDDIGDKIVVFEFTWATNARFQDVAGDLKKAIEYIYSKTGESDVHIIAHSFGGILARTYLQGLAVGSGGASLGDYESHVASLVTVGTPHSGIADEVKDMHNVPFPDGQDSWTFIGGRQISVHQMGEYVKFADVFNYLFDIESNPGFIAAEISNTVDNPFPEALPVYCLIGLTTERGRNSKVDNGDGLITFDGQRFMPDFRQTAHLLDDASVFGIRLTEQVLGSSKGVSIIAVKPGSDNPWSGSAYNKFGYRHSEKIALTANLDDANIEVKIDLADKDKHATFLNVRDWLMGVYSISGTITGDIQEGVTITLSGDSSDSTITASDGTFSFTGIDNGSYTVTPSLAGYSFDPLSIPVTIDGNNEIGVDFTATENSIGDSGNLPDTGQTKCYNNTQEIACPNPGEDFYGQDAQYSCNPQSYTLLAGDLMVEDNVTGLVWQRDTAPGYYDWDEALSYCQNLMLEGYSDWRLPTIKELSTLVNSSIPYSGPTIDTDYFPNTGKSYYWSSTAEADLSNEAWSVRFNYSLVRRISKPNNVYVRAVRGGQSSNDFIDNGDWTITDTSTGLMWEVKTDGGPRDKNKEYNWQDALSYCENLSLAGYDDWRLPNRNELQSIVDYNRYSPSIDPIFFNTVSAYYWSSTTDAYLLNDAWYVRFDSGWVDNYHKSGDYYVRAVRGGQCGQTDGEYLEIDISAGPSASSYPVTELSSQPTLTDEYKKTKILLRRIPSAGQTFNMGSPEDENGRHSDETQHLVTFTKDYYIGVFEVTQSQYGKVTGYNPSYYQGDMRPVGIVNWDRARGGIWPGDPAGSGLPGSNTFIGRLCSRTGLDFDLPTEAQWEYACRATTLRAYNDYTKNGGEGADCLNAGTGTDANLDPLGRYYYNGGSSNHHIVVGSYQPNLWGLYDMHGNVAEWCLDWDGYYDGDETDPLGPSSGTKRVGRGGCWYSSAWETRSADRVFNYSNIEGSTLGFRLALPQ